MEEGEGGKEGEGEGGNQSVTYLPKAYVCTQQSGKAYDSPTQSAEYQVLM